MTRYRRSGSTGRREGFSVVEAARRGQRLTATDLAGEAAPSERAPDDRADALIDAQRHQLPTRNRDR